MRAPLRRTTDGERWFPHAGGGVHFRLGAAARCVLVQDRNELVAGARVPAVIGGPVRTRRAVRVVGGVELECLLLADRTMIGYPEIQQHVYAMLRAQALSPEDTLGLLDRLLGER